MEDIGHFDVVCPKCAHINALFTEGAAADTESGAIDPNTEISCAECGAVLGAWIDLRRVAAKDLEVLFSVKDSQWGGPAPTDQQALDRCCKKGWIIPIAEGSHVYRLTEVGLQVLGASDSDVT